MFKWLKWKKRPKRAKRPKKKSNVCSYWLVTVGGFDGLYDPPSTAVSKVIALDKKDTPIEWFAVKPVVSDRFEFTPTVLYGFWRITRTQFEDFGSPPRPFRNNRHDKKGGK